MTIIHIEQFTLGMTKNEFLNDYKLCLAVVKLLEIIGEASAHLSSELKEMHPGIEWVTLKGIRNIFVHEYFGIDYEIVWKAIQDKLPSLKEKIALIVEGME
ncbi:MAG: HepT-like ribonuclease domain-containing protein [Chitinophagales bacterium]|nr:HepT-like ribonuclease domain-containing protein [Chitinophagales bacterium]